MRAWLSETSITIEGAPDEWQVLLSRLVTAYQETQTTDYMWHEFLRYIKEEARRRQDPPAHSNRRADLEWYDRNQK